MEIGLLLAAAVILLCVVLNKFAQKIGIPILLAFILLGLAFGTDGILKIPFENYHFSEQICTTALIFIMFYGGFGTNWKHARPAAAKSALLSTLGVVITAALTGAFCHFILKIELLESLLIGAVISSTDAASVFSILRSKKLGLKNHTDSMLELESGSNDPCSYMLTVILLSIMEAKGAASPESILWLCLAQYAFGILSGVAIGFAAAFIMRRFQFKTDGFDMAFITGSALLAYSAAALAGGNGYLSVYLCGIILGNQKIRNKKALVHFFDGITGLMQMLIFFLLGLLATPSEIPKIFLPALAIMLFLTFLARPISVFSILSPFRCKIRQQLLVSFAGLRGAASIVFAIMATVSPAYLDSDLYHIVFCIVLLSISFQGTLLPLCAKWLGMTDSSIDVLKTFSDYSEKSDLHFIKIKIAPEHPWINKEIRSVTLPPDTLIILILRGGKRLIPNGKTVLEKDDTAVLSAYKYKDEDNISLQEIVVPPNSDWVGKTISDFSPQAGELVIMVIRGHRTLLPKGTTKIKANDILVIHSDETEHNVEPLYQQDSQLENKE